MRHRGKVHFKGKIFYVAANGNKECCVLMWTLRYARVYHEDRIKSQLYIGLRGLNQIIPTLQ